MPEQFDPLLEFDTDYLKKIQQEYVLSIPQKIKTLKSILNKMHIEMSEQSLQELKLSIHRIAGSAGTYGFMKVSEICKDFEKEIDKKIAFFKAFGAEKSWLIDFEKTLKHIEYEFLKR